MGEPWASFGLPAGLPAYAVARMRAADAREQRAEVERQAELADRAEARRAGWLLARAQQLALLGRPFDLARPETLAESAEEMANRVFAAMDLDAARAERRALVEAGLLHELEPGLGPRPPMPGTAAAVVAEHEQGELAARSRRMSVHNTAGNIRRQRRERRELVR
jgi:hypothetical protein